MKRVFLHILLWSAYVAAEMLTNWPHYRDWEDLLRQTIFFLPLIALPFYFTAYYLAPRLLWQGKKALFWSAVAGIALLQMIFRMQLTHWYWMITSGETEVYLPFSKISKNLFRDYSVTALAVCLKIIRDWDKRDRLTTQLAHEKRDAELQFLRAQIHPHFLFNTLNNIYGLSLIQSPHTPDSILRLSGLLDFMLYECNAERIPVSKEIALIEQYIALEKLRFGERLQLVFEAERPPDNVRIAPLLLLPFVENAFKHSAKVSDEQTSIRIHLHYRPNTLHFEVENARETNTEKTSADHSGIGLKNVEKRLDLLYPKRYRLHCAEKEKTYLAVLYLEVG